MEWLKGFFDIILNFTAQGLGYEKIAFRLPQAFYLLYVVPVILLLGIREIVGRSRLVKKVGFKSTLLRDLTKLAGLLIASFLFITALADPYSVTIIKFPIFKGEVVDFFLDGSISQKAEDVSPNRFTAVKKQVEAAVDKLRREGVSRFCLGIFSSSPNRLVECTDEIDNFKEILGRLEINMNQAGGTNLLSAFGEDYDFIKEILPDNTKITLVVITDGGREMWLDKNGGLKTQEPDWNEADLEKRIGELRNKYKISVLAVGVGKTKPVPVPLIDLDGNKKFVKTYDGETLFTQLDEKILKKIALWAGDENRYFLLREETGNNGENSFAEWLVSRIVSERIIEGYKPEEKTSDLWRYVLGSAIFTAAVSLGVFGFVKRFKFKRKVSKI